MARNNNPTKRNKRVSTMNRANISWSDETRSQAEALAQRDRRSVSNLLAVLVDKAWQELHGAAQAQTSKSTGA